MAAGYMQRWALCSDCPDNVCEVGGSGKEELKKRPSLSPAVLWVVNVRERKPRKKKQGIWSRIRKVHVLKMQARFFMYNFWKSSISGKDVEMLFFKEISNDDLMRYFFSDDNYIIPSRPNPGRREKVKLNFYFHTSMWCLKSCL